LEARLTNVLRAQFLLIGLLVALWGISAGLPAQQPDEAAIQRYSQEARQAMAAKDPEAAAAALEKLVRLTPDVAAVHANLGMVYYAQGNYHKATEAFERAVQLSPRMAEAKLMLGICYAETGKFQEAIPILDPAFRHPANSETGRAIGLQLLHAYTALRQPAKASEVSEELLSRYPDDPEILYRASRMHSDRSLQVMLHLVDVAPESAWKRMAFGEVHEAQKRYDLAIIEYRNALRRDPTLPTLHFHLGHAILLNAQDNEAARDQALQEFQQELAVDPHNPDAEYEIGEINRERGQLDQAREHFLRAIQNDSRFEEAQVAVARILVDLKKPKEALPYLLVAVRLDPADEISHFLLARVYSALGDVAKSQDETQLFQKYHALSDPHPTGGEAVPEPLTSTEVTRQTLDSESKPRP
jgi:tetratricopeptide (TPR) repeat protein